MQIVIDIDEGRYNWIMSHASKHPYDYADASDLFFRTAVERGIVLPKGHGDLIDRDALELPSEEMVSKMIIFGATAIIEADK